MYLLDPRSSLAIVGEYLICQRHNFCCTLFVLFVHVKKKKNDYLKFCKVFFLK